MIFKFLSILFVFRLICQSVDKVVDEQTVINSVLFAQYLFVIHSVNALHIFVEGELMLTITIRIE